MSYEQLGNSRVESRAQVSKLFLYSLLADVHAEGSKDGSEVRRLELQRDQGYEATCVRASIDEFSKCTTGIATPKISELLQVG